MRTLSVGDCVRFGWETFKQRPWFLIGALLLAMIISSLPSMFVSTPQVGPDGQIIPQPLTTLDAIMSIASIIASIFVGIGITTFSLRAHDNVQGVQLSDLWNPSPFWRFLGAHILTLIAVTLGMLALIVPGIIIAMGLAFVPYLVVERGLGPVEALKESWRITKGHKMQIFLLVLALIGINILGLMALVVGVFVTFPLTLLAFAHAYRTLAT